MPGLFFIKVPGLKSSRKVGLPPQAAKLFSRHSACNLTHFSKETPLRSQTSSEQADAQSRTQVSREMLPVHCHAWKFLSIVTLECTSPAERFPPKIVNEKKFLSIQQIQKNWTALLQRILNRQVHSQIKIHLKKITKIRKYKKLKCKYQRINTQPIKTKTIKYTHRLRYITSTWIALLKLANTTNWTWPNTKKTWSILKLTNTKKLNSNSMTEHKTDMNITKIGKYNKTEQQFYDGAQNRHGHY